MTIPDSLLNDIDYVLCDSSPGPVSGGADGACPPGRVTLLMRHSVRFPIIDPAEPLQAQLTEEGVRLAEELGGMLGERFVPGRLRSSPVRRCRATAEAIARGAGWPVKVRADRRLGHPYIERVWSLVEHGGLDGSLPEPVPEVLRWILGAPEITHQAYLPLLEQRPVLDVLVTHDTLVCVVAACLLRCPVLGPDWPGYLEGVLFWWEDGQVHARWRGVEGMFSKQFTRIEVP